MTRNLQFYGKFWIKPADGKCIECTADEHARIARGFMLSIPEDDLRRTLPLNDIFKPLTPEQADMWLRRGVCPHAVAFLCSDDAVVDPRLYVIKNWNWIRVRESDFYAWNWDHQTLDTLSKADEFWQQQKKATGKSWVTLWNVADSSYMTGALEVLLPRFAEKKKC